jgi:predicted signal transduction protein with EAL and GGDEF domain
LVHRDEDPEFRRAQYLELSRQIPLMYAIVNMAMLALTYVGKAPAILSIWLYTRSY